MILLQVYLPSKTLTVGMVAVISPATCEKEECPSFDKQD